MNVKVTEAKSEIFSEFDHFGRLDGGLIEFVEGEDASDSPGDDFVSDFVDESFVG